MRQYGTSAMIIQFQLLFASRPACCYRFEACSAFTRVTACTLAVSPIRETLTRGFSHFVTSMTAPVASGWSVCLVGLASAGKRRPVTAHSPKGYWVATPGRRLAALSHPPRQRIRTSLDAQVSRRLEER